MFSKSLPLVWSSFVIAADKIHSNKWLSSGRAIWDKITHRNHFKISLDAYWTVVVVVDWIQHGSLIYDDDMRCLARVLVYRNGRFQLLFSVYNTKKPNKHERSKNKKKKQITVKIFAAAIFNNNFRVIWCELFLLLLFCFVCCWLWLLIKYTVSEPKWKKDHSVCKVISTVYVLYSTCYFGP